MTESLPKVLCHIQLHFLAFSVMNQEPAIKLGVEFQVPGGEEGGVGGDSLATVQGDKDVLVKDVSEDIIAIVDGMMEKLVDRSKLLIFQLEPVADIKKSGSIVLGYVNIGGRIFTNFLKVRQEM